MVVSDILESLLLVRGWKEMTRSPSMRQGYTGHWSRMCRYWCRPVTLLLFSFLKASASFLTNIHF